MINYIHIYYGDIIHQRCYQDYTYAYTLALTCMQVYIHHIHLTTSWNTHTHTQHVLLQLSIDSSDSIVIEEHNFLSVQL